MNGIKPNAPSAPPTSSTPSAASGAAVTAGSLGDGYAAGTGGGIFSAMSGTELEAMLTANPKFAALIRLMEAAQQQKENAQELLNSTSGELDEKTMAIYTQANKMADQLIQTATNVQKSNNDIMDTLARNN